MAHHGSTPRSILDAPKLTPRWLVVNQYLNRAERRRRARGLPRPMRLQRVRLEARNEPYRKPPGVTDA